MVKQLYEKWRYFERGAVWNSSTETVVTAAAQAGRAEGLLQRGEAAPMPEIPVDEWTRRLKSARVLGLKSVRGWTLADGKRGPRSGLCAADLSGSLRLTAPGLGGRAGRPPDSDVTIAEQASLKVARDLQALLSHLNLAAGVALVATMLTSVRSPRSGSPTAGPNWACCGLRGRGRRGWCGCRAAGGWRRGDRISGAGVASGPVGPDGGGETDRVTYLPNSSYRDLSTAMCSSAVPFSCA